MHEHPGGKEFRAKDGDGNTAATGHDAAEEEDAVEDSVGSSGSCAGSGDRVERYKGDGGLVWTGGSYDSAKREDPAAFSDTMSLKIALHYSDNTL
jgi:hypothetical protein